MGSKLIQEAPVDFFKKIQAVASSSKNTFTVEVKIKYNINHIKLNTFSAQV